MTFFLGFVMLVYMWMLTSTSANPAEASLKSDLFASYDKHLLPTLDKSQEVLLGMSLNRLKGLDFFKGTIQMNVWFRMRWNDLRLVWDPSNYKNISIIRVHSSEVWKPDITLYNSHSPSESLADVSVMMHSDGTVLYLPPMAIEAACDLDLRDYPYDSHSCRLKLGSWTQDNLRISLKAWDYEINFIDGDYWENAIWDITNTSAAQNTVSYPCCSDVYEDITFHLTLCRRETHGRIASSVITAWLILIVFLIRTSGERIVYAGFVFVALVVLSAAISSEIPAYSVTRLGRFLIGGMLITAVVLVVNGLIYRFNPKEQPGNFKEGSGSPSRLSLFIDIAAFLGTAIILAISTGALFT